VLLSGTHGFAAAGIGTILETSDGGRAWTVAHSEPPGFNSYLYGIAFSSATSGYAVGMDGVILTTSDGGASWVHRSSGVISDLRDVHPLSATEALVVGDGGMVLLTSDAGVTWERVHSGTTTDLWAIEVPVGGVPLVAGDWGTVLEPATPLFADDFESGDTGAWSG